MNLSKSIEWVYPRAEGDLTVYAETAEDALRCLREEHGFRGLDPAKLKARGKRLTDAIDAASQSVNSERMLLARMGKL